MLVNILCVAASSDWPLYANGLGSPLHMVVVYTNVAQGATFCGRRSVGLLSDGPHNEGNEWIHSINHRSRENAGICRLYK